MIMAGGCAASQVQTEQLKRKQISPTQRLTDVQHSENQENPDPDPSSRASIRRYAQCVRISPTKCILAVARSSNEPVETGLNILRGNQRSSRQSENYECFISAATGVAPMISCVK